MGSSHQSVNAFSSWQCNSKTFLMMPAIVSTACERRAPGHANSGALMFAVSSACAAIYAARSIWCEFMQAPPFGSRVGTVPLGAKGLKKVASSTNCAPFNPETDTPLCRGVLFSRLGARIARHQRPKAYRMQPTFGTLGSASTGKTRQGSPRSLHPTSGVTRTPSLCGTAPKSTAFAVR